MKLPNLKYKGSRNYLQGGDIYNAIIESVSSEFGGHLVRLVFKRFARNQIEMVLNEPESAEEILGAGTWLKSSGDRMQFWLLETDQLVTGTYPFDEDAITRPAMIDERTIRGKQTNPYSLIENIIALTKRLNYMLAPDVEGKWLFGQLDLKEALPNDWNDLVIARTVAVGNAFSRNRISIDGQEFGEIRFIGGKP